MAGRQIFNPDGFKNIEEDGKIIGFSFQFKCQYYRSVTLSIVRNLAVNVDGEDFPKEDITLTINGETFTQDQMTTVIDSDYRWEFGEYGTVNVKKEGGLAAGPHHIKAVQLIVPSYMPFPWEVTCEADFEIK